MLDILPSIAYPTIVSQRDISIPVAAKNGTIVTDNNLAIQAGLAVLT